VYPICFCDFFPGSEDVSRRGSVVCGFELFLYAACLCDFLDKMWSVSGCCSRLEVCPGVTKDCEAAC
jgi:hypothetical protein